MRTAAGVWRLADPKVSLASFAALFLGAATAAASGPLDWPWLGLTVAGVFALEVAKNASGEVVDWDTGVDLAVAPEDRSPFSGGKRVLVDRLLTRSQTRAVAAVAYVLAVAAGLAIVLAREPRVLWLGLVGVTLAYGYHARPLRLAYRGLGELAVAVAYGPLITCGTWLVLRGTVTPPVVLASSALGVLVAAFLWINQFPDYRADRTASKRNLVVRLGPARAAGAFGGLLAVAGLLGLAVPAAGGPVSSLAGLVALLPLGWAFRRLWREHAVTSRVIPAQAATLIGFLLYAVGAGLGWLVAPPGAAP